MSDNHFSFFYDLCIFASNYNNLQIRHHQNIPHYINRNSISREALALNVIIFQKAKKNDCSESYIIILAYNFSSTQKC